MSEETPAILDAAERAWRLSGYSCQVLGADIAPNLLGVLRVPEARRVEVAVANDASDSVWLTLAGLETAPSWRLCALVPRRWMGKAHGALRESGHDVQPWWVDAQGRVAFGAVERA